MREGESKGDREGGRKKGPFICFSWASSPSPISSHGAERQGPSEQQQSQPLPSSVTQATKTSTVSMKLYRDFVNCKSTSNCLAFGSSGEK